MFVYTCTVDVLFPVRHTANQHTYVFIQEEFLKERSWSPVRNNLMHVWILAKFDFWLRIDFYIINIHSFWNVYLLEKKEKNQFLYEKCTSRNLQCIVNKVQSRIDLTLSCLYVITEL